ncbi:Conjugal transfer protein TraA [Rickettsia canadensis str. McKiel]|uniref:Conjugal transfer protein TraA n=1 Tax=Rickettsia canadensis (strain McKiel) TaxID=293613 RepID=A8EYN9_RICCK|nr:Conjugal transfer protein TraA [Rickettsia canadensis str. McKiel]
MYNGKAELPRNTTLVVDEAGMVGNSDYLELLKVARSNNCNVILAGGER